MNFTYFNYRISHKNDPAYRQSNIKSSVMDQNIFRGFSVTEINIKHRVSQGYDEMNRISKKTINRPMREETVNQLFLSDSSSSIKDGESDVELSDLSKESSKGTRDEPKSNKNKNQMSIDFKKEVLKRKSRK